MLRWEDAKNPLTSGLMFLASLQLLLIVVGCLLVVTILRPYIYLAATPLAIIFMLMRKYFLRTGQQLKQLETEGESVEASFWGHGFDMGTGAKYANNVGLK